MKNLSVALAFLVSLLCLGSSFKAQAESRPTIEPAQSSLVSKGKDDKGKKDGGTDDDEEKEEDLYRMVPRRLL
jgi:hypothetical protein